MPLKWSRFLGVVILQVIFEGKKGKMSRSWKFDKGDITKLCLNAFFVRG